MQSGAATPGIVSDDAVVAPILSTGGETPKRAARGKPVQVHNTFSYMYVLPTQAS